MSDSKRSSKSDLNESNMPLIEDEKKEKEELEMKEGEEKGEKDSKKKKEKKPKKEKGPGCVQTMSSGLNVKDRDDKSINVEIDLGFDDVLAEPDNAQGFEWMWRLSYVVFSQSKLWLYRILAAFVAIPMALIWAAVFAFVTVLYVWVLAPLIRLIEFDFYLIKRLFGGFVRAFLDPLHSSIGLIFSGVQVNHRQTINNV